MSTKDFMLPDLGEGLTEGEVVGWLVAVGDVVEVDQDVVEIETAKAVVEVPSPYGGTVVALHGEPGQEIAVGSPLITIEVGGDADPAPAAEPAEEGSGNVLVGYGTSTGGGSRRRRVGTGGDAPPIRPDGRPMAKPPVRKLAREHDIDLHAVNGSGPDGIITREDVQTAIDGTAAPSAPAPDAAPGPGSGSDAPATAAAAPSAAPAPAAAPAAAAALVPGQRVPLGQMRKAISAQMTRSRHEIPEAVTWVEADATPLWELRDRLNAAQAGQPDGVKVSPLAIILRMVVAGLKRYPTLNASVDVDAGEMVLHDRINLGVAAQTDRGLVVPVIHDAQTMSILDLARALGERADTARAGRLQPADMAGGTFTVSNYGAFGVDGGDMVINHPEAAILGTGRIVDKPWVVDGQVVVRKIITYSVAFDHRIIDGGEGAGFIRLLADLTEDPVLLTATL